jgi:uroporphyrinogen-III synthase
VAGALAGRTVVVTRAAEQADDLVRLLEAEGAVPVVVPLIDIVPEPAGVAALAALDPAGFDWLVVTSPNGARAMLDTHRAMPPRIAAVGTTTATVISAAGHAVDLVPAQQSADGLADAFHQLNDPASGRAVADQRIVVVQAVDAEPVLVDRLRALGHAVTAVAPYRSVPAHPTASVQLRAIAADVVLFASGSAARAWVEVFGTTTPPVTVAIGPRCETAATRAGLKISLVATDHSLVGMLDVIRRYFATND